MLPLARVLALISKHRGQLMRPTDRVGRGTMGHQVAGAGRESLSRRLRRHSPSSGRTWLWMPSK
eukprot:6210501-Pleurochrysis_carterae.AAC.1